MAMNATIAVRDIRFRYPDGTEALRGVSFGVEAGERIALVGPNGSGKSTLLLHCNGLLPERLAGDASVVVDDVVLGPGTVNEIRRKVGLLFQDPDDQLFCPTVFEDVAFGPEQYGWTSERIDAAVRTALHTTDLDGYGSRSPHHLSSGEKRRVCLAGVLACEPRVLVLDEPTSNLDPRGKRHLLTTLRSLDATMIVATHDLELVVELCPRTIVLDAGVVVADGRTAEVLADEALMLAHGLEKPHILRHSHPH
jgi:energy-coupling factor transporter ATP-binding protein EcfA2